MTVNNRDFVTKNGLQTSGAANVNGPITANGTITATGNLVTSDRVYSTGLSTTQANNQNYILVAGGNTTNMGVIYGFAGGAQRWAMTTTGNNVNFTANAGWNYNFSSAPSLVGGNFWTSINDGSGSGLDADLLRGMQPTNTATENTIIMRGSNGGMVAGLHNSVGSLAGFAMHDRANTSRTWTAYASGDNFRIHQHTVARDVLTVDINGAISSNGVTSQGRITGAYDFHLVGVNNGMWIQNRSNSDDYAHQYFNVGRYYFYFSGSTTTTMQVRSDGIVEVLNDIVITSDRTKKENIEAITPKTALDVVLSWNGYKYNKINDSEKRRYAGVMAQDLQITAPELVDESDDGTLVVGHTGIHAYTIEAIKELEKRIRILESEE